MIKKFDFELTSSGISKHISLTEKEAYEIYLDLKLYFDNKSIKGVPNSLFYPKFIGDTQFGPIDKKSSAIQSTISDELLDKIKNDLSYCQKYNTMSDSQDGC